MNHGLMVGMFWGGVLVASIPTLLVIGVGILMLRHYRRERRREAAAGARTEEVSP